MKKAFLFNLLLMSLFVAAQSSKENYVYLERKSNTTHTFKAKIGNVPATFHIEFVNLAGNYMSAYQYFVKGWYSYNHIRKPIKLVGFFNFEDYTLYHFSKNSTAENYLINNYYPLNKQDSIALKNNVKEIIKFNWDEYSSKRLPFLEGKYYGYKKILPTKLLTESGNVFYDYELLKLPNGKIYNTKDIIQDYAGNKLISCYIDKNEIRILLKYSHLSNPNGYGPCYADEDNGYRILTLNKNWKFIKTESYELQRCQPLLELKELKTKNKNLEKFYIEDLDEKFFLTIDFAKSRITKSFK